MGDYHTSYIRKKKWCPAPPPSSDPVVTRFNNNLLAPALLYYEMVFPEDFCFKVIFIKVHNQEYSTFCNIYIYIFDAIFS